MVRRASDGTRRIPFAIGDELSAIHCGDVSQSSAEILLHSNYEETDMKNWRTKLISILRTRLTLENWRAKLISLIARDNALVPDQKEPNDDVLAV